MIRAACIALGAAAAYGFSIGCVHSVTYGVRNLLKFPLLVGGTCAVCAVAYWVLGQMVSRALSFREVQALAVRTFRDLAVLLASLSPACLFLACTLRRPDAQGLHEYPLFLGLNACLIAGCGALALVRQSRELLRQFGFGLPRRVAVTLGWLALSLFVGGQWAWTLRPFFGVSTIPADAVPLFMGSLPDFRGDTSFYEAVWHVVAPPRS